MPRKTFRRSSRADKTVTGQCQRWSGERTRIQPMEGVLSAAPRSVRSTKSFTVRNFPMAKWASTRLPLYSPLVH